MRTLLCRLLANAGLVAVSLLAGLILLETGLRAWDGVPLLAVTNFARERVDQLRANSHSVYDDRLGWRSKPNLHEPSENTDADGIRRTAASDRAVPQGAILAVGDSFTWGSDVDDRGAWPAQLEELAGTAVVNAASPGWGTDQIVMRAEEMLAGAQPKVLILGIFWPDIQRAEMAVNFGAYKPYYTVETGGLLLHNVPVPRVTGALHDIGNRAVLGYSYAVTWLSLRLGFAQWLVAAPTLFKRATPDGTGRDITCRLLEQVKQRTERERVRPLLVMQYGHIDFGRPQRREALAVLDCARRHGIATIDTWSAIAELYERDRNRFDALYVVQESGWSHMSAAGNRLVAEAIAERLRASREP
jgi:lysophospholipase L1-like esterase